MPEHRLEPWIVGGHFRPFKRRQGLLLREEQEALARAFSQEDWEVTSQAFAARRAELEAERPRWLHELDRGGGRGGR